MRLDETPGPWGAKRAVEIAAAGGHPLLLVAPREAGTARLARCLPGLLPPLSRQEARELGVEASSPRPVRSPGAGLSVAEFLGDAEHPGEARLAHHGVLLLEELPAFAPEVLAGLLEVLETGSVEPGGQRRPALFQLVAMATSQPPLTEEAVWRRRWGPIRELVARFDLRKEVEVQRSGERGDVYVPQERVLERVAAARAAQRRRGCLNTRLSQEDLGRGCRMGSGVLVALQGVCASLPLGPEGCQALARVARTIADLDGREQVSEQDVLEAVFYQLWNPWELLGTGVEVA